MQAATHNPYQRAQSAQQPKPQSICKAFFGHHNHHPESQTDYEKIMRKTTTMSLCFFRQTSKITQTYLLQSPGDVFQGFIGHCYVAGKGFAWLTPLSTHKDQ